MTDTVRRLLEIGVISISNSLFNVTPTIVKKPNNKGYRFTLNLIPINEQFELNPRPHTRVELVHRRGKNKRWKTVIDLKDAFF